MTTDSTHTLAQGFLLAAGAIFLLAYALPLFFVPLAWAKRFRWTVPDDQALTIYFGRCLGAVGIVVVVLALRAAADPVAHREVFDLIILFGAMLTVVHAWGAIRRIQPWTESVETALYLVATIVAIWVRSTLG